MDSIRIIGGRPLVGRIPISGAKNAALPLMAASLLTEDSLTLSNLPHLADISTMANLLNRHGVAINMEGGSADLGHTDEASVRAVEQVAYRQLKRRLALGNLIAEREADELEALHTSLLEKDAPGVGLTGRRPDESGGLRRKPDVIRSRASALKPTRASRYASDTVPLAFGALSAMGTIPPSTSVEPKLPSPRSK